MKKLFSILLAICLIAGLLPVVASAAGETAKATFINSEGGDTVKVEATNGGEPKYLITENGYAQTNTANADNYNIKFEYVDGNPTIFLKGANLKAPVDKMCINLHSIGDSSKEFVICIEEESFIESSGQHAIRADSTHVRVTGPGKLNLTVTDGVGIAIYDSQIATMNARYDITLDDANIQVSATSTGVGKTTSCFGNHIRDFTVSGGTLKAELNKTSVLCCLPYKMGSKGDGDPINSNLIITNSPEIDIQGTGASGFGRVENSITIESGNIKIRHADTSAFYAGKEFKIYGGTIDVVGGPFSYSPTSVKIDFGDYAEDCTIVVCNSTDGKGAVQYDPDKSAQQDRYVYFKISPGVSYEVAVMKGTTDLSVASKGDTVTITARIAPEGTVFDKWEVNNGDVKLADPTASTTTFTMPGENVKITATYKSEESTEESTPEESTEETTPEESLPHVSLPQESTPEESTPDASTPDTDNNDGGNKKPATSNKGNGGFIALFIIMIVLLVLAIAAVVVFTIITMKKMGIQLFKAKAPAAIEEATEEAAEEATEETAEDAE